MHTSPSLRRCAAERISRGTSDPRTRLPLFSSRTLRVLPENVPSKLKGYSWACMPSGGEFVHIPSVVDAQNGMADWLFYFQHNHDNPTTTIKDEEARSQERRRPHPSRHTPNERRCWCWCPTDLTLSWWSFPSTMGRPTRTRTQDRNPRVHLFGCVMLVVVRVW